MTNPNLTIGSFTKKAIKALESAGVTSARLDTYILLEDALGRSRAWLLAHPDAVLNDAQSLALAGQLTRRAARTPLAYIRGNIEFYGRLFRVTNQVLIPRPETEALIEQLSKLALPPRPRLLDVGTGSGIIAVTAALELPAAAVDACDISPAALTTARANARRHKAKVNFFVSDLLSNVAGLYHAIFANLPYVDRSWERSPETAFEPPLALFAGQGGLELIYKLIAAAPGVLTPGGYLILEADPRQHTTIQKAANGQGLALVAAHNFMLCFQKRQERPGNSANKPDAPSYL